MMPKSCGRSSATLMIRFRQYKKLWSRWLKRQRKGSFAQSHILTLLTKPLWQHEHIRLFMGAPLVASMVTGAALQFPQSDSLQSWSISQPTTEIQGLQVQLTTDNTYLLPVVQLTGISQFFHTGHPGIDFRAPRYSDVIAMESGTVEIRDEKYGYGRHVFVTNKTTGRVTLYAHLGLIMVEAGEEIQAGVKIGEVGMTGWTTGPHLHFEVRENGKAVNPLAYLSKAITTYASVKTQ